MKKLQARLFSGLIFEQRLGRNHYFWLLGNFALLFLPLYGHIPIAFFVSGLALLCVKLGEVLGKFPGMPRWATNLLAVLALIATHQSYQTILGYEAGTTLLLILAGLKVLEVKNYRDYMITLLLFYFLLTGSLLFNQGIAITVFLFIATLAVTVTMVRMHVTDLESLRMGDLLKRSLQLVAYSLPVFVGLFIVFPRFVSPLSVGSSDRQSISGFDDELNPGDVSELALSDEVAFRAYFPTGSLPKMQDRYWRGLVLDQSQGLKWTRTRTAKSRLEKGDDIEARSRESIEFETEIVLEPRFGQTLFTLDRPIEIPGTQLNFRLLRKLGDVYELRDPPSQKVRYKVSSTLASDLTEAHQRPQWTQLPETTSPRLKNWIRKLYDSASTPADRVQLLLEEFRQFRYTLTPKALGREQLEGLVFETKEGFCGHFAGAFASLARLMNIPARVVLGFHGGEVSRLSVTDPAHVTLRGQDAHAWAEVWLPEKGWTRVDPTAYVAPLRLLAGGQRYAQYGPEGLVADASGNLVVRGDWLPQPLRRFWSGSQMIWDLMQARWDRFLLNYDLEAQRQWLSRLGLQGSPRLVLALGTVLVLALGILVYSLYLRRRRLRVGRTSELFLKSVEVARKWGVDKMAHEPPIAFGARVSQHLELRGAHHMIQDWQLLINTYVTHRFGANHGGGLGSEINPSEFRHWMRWLRRASSAPIVAIKYSVTRRLP